MIVAPMFVGDDDRCLMNLQHEVYGQAIALLLAAYNRAARLARVLLYEATPPRWPYLHDCDHRCLQSVHDLLAAAWRHRADVRQESLQLVGEPPNSDPVHVWLQWLEAELRGWEDTPILLRELLEALAFQNSPIGYAAESRLCLNLLDRYAWMPWKPSLREAFEKDHRNDTHRL